MPGGKDNAAACTLHSPTQPVSDGYDGTQARLMIQPDAVLIVTQAPLDPSFTDIGLQVDERPFVHIDEVVERKTGRFASPYGRLIEQFKAGRRVRVQLRFWPTWPVTGTHSVRFSLIGFTKAYADMQACAHEPTTDGGQKP